MVNPNFVGDDLFPCTAGADLFLCCVDIHGIVSTHVETVVCLSKKNMKPKDYVEIGVDAEDYYKIKEGK